jgi:hypothetical protein
MTAPCDQSQGVESIRPEPGNRYVNLSSKSEMRFPWVATGCPVVALNSDLPRQPRRFRTVFDAGVRTLAGTLAGWMEAAGIAGGEALAASVLAAMAGAVAVSRSVSDKRLSDELLAAARVGVKARLGLSNGIRTGDAAL